MATLAADPGYNFTGVAAYDPVNMWWEASQFLSPVDAYDWLFMRYVPGDSVLVEDFSRAGFLDKEAKETVKVIGFLENSFLRNFQLAPVLINPQARLSSVTEATEMYDSLYPKVTQPNKKDAIAALAHAVSWERKKKTCT